MGLLYGLFNEEKDGSRLLFNFKTRVRYFSGKSAKSIMPEIFII